MHNKIPGIKDIYAGYLIVSLQLPVNHLQKRLGLVFQQGKPRVFPEDDIPVLINNNVHPACHGEEPVIGVIDCNNLFFFVREKCQFFKTMFRDKFLVRLDRVNAYSNNLDIS